MPLEIKCPICNKKVMAGFNGVPYGLYLYHRIDKGLGYKNPTHIWYEIADKIFLDKTTAYNHIHLINPKRFNLDWVKDMIK